jgi:DNA polymerase III subunit gamma/tau
MSFGITYRPLSFGEVVGSDVVVKILQSTIKDSDFGRSYIFSGPHGIGKTSIARIFARSILCSNRLEDMSPCNECSSCKSHIGDRHENYLEVDAATKGKKEDIAEILETLSYQNSVGKMIILLDESHRISPSGKDALLKILERDSESEGFVFLFCTTDGEAMPGSLKSRSESFNILQPTTSMIKSKLKAICEAESLTYEEDGLTALAEASDGHFRDAENAMKTVSRVGDISLDNVCSVISQYKEEVSQLLINMSMDLKSSLDTLESLQSKMSVKDIYSQMLKILVGATRVGLDLKTGKSVEDGYESRVYHSFSDKIPNIIDYILNKDKMKDSTVIQSDVILMHYKFLRNGFDAAEVKAKSSPGKTSQVNSLKSSDKNKDSVSDKKLEWHEKSALIRQQKAASRKSTDVGLDETITQKWGNDKIPHKVVSLSRSSESGR